MSGQTSTMSPKRLFIILCLAGLLMWFFSKSKVEVEFTVEPETETKEIINKKSPKEIKVNKKNKKRSKTKKKDIVESEDFDNSYLRKRELNYDPYFRELN